VRKPKRETLWEAFDGTMHRSEADKDAYEHDECIGVVFQARLDQLVRAIHYPSRCTDDEHKIAGALMAAAHYATVNRKRIK
jgi:hypothetical protein